MLRELIDVTEDYQRMKVEFNDLYEQDKHRVHKERADLLRENQLYNARYINSQLWKRPETWIIVRNEVRPLLLLVSHPLVLRVCIF